MAPAARWPFPPEVPQNAVMERFFSTADPVDPEIHYLVPPLSRIDLPETLRLIEQRQYVVLHAPRRTGKTSCLLALMAHLNREGRHACLYSNVEAGQAARENVAAAMEAILGRLVDDARHYLNDASLLERYRSVLETYGPLGALESFLSGWAAQSPRPVVLLLDEVDALVGLVIANPIYKEALPRALAQGPQDSLPSIQPTWLDRRGKLDGERLLEAVLAFWRRHGQPLLASAPYHEIAPHLVLMAFLHRVVNGGGTLEREYANGSGRMDLCLRYGEVVLGIELKVWRDGAADPLVEGLEQLDSYLAGLGVQSGWLVVFDRRSGQPPIAERTTVKTVTSAASRTVAAIRAQHSRAGSAGGRASCIRASGYVFGGGRPRAVLAQP